jgi:hypothetical protein
MFEKMLQRITGASPHLFFVYVGPLYVRFVTCESEMRVFPKTLSDSLQPLPFCNGIGVVNYDR